MKKANRDDLSLENRMTKIIQELINLDPDVICLQEADLITYRTYIQHNLSNDYNFVYGVNCGSSFINVVGFKKKYRLVSFKNFSLLEIKITGNRGIMNVNLENIASKEIISIYNVHFPWRQEFQRCQLLELIFKHIEDFSEIENVFIAGDFNSEPASLPIKLIYYGNFIKENLFEEKDFVDNGWVVDKGYDNNDKFNLFENVYQKFQFRSAYENYKKFLYLNKLNSRNKKKLHFKNSVSGNKCNQNKNSKFINNFKNHPDMTSCTAYFKNNIDYIFYSKKFKLTKVLKIPSNKEIEEDIFLPSSKFPSDHLKIFAEFELI
jgi:mRNA deadenylase 3'-5' endonuclease subunit Ccr4